MLRQSVFLPAVDVFQHPIDKTSLNDGQLRAKTKQSDVSCKTSPPHSLQAAPPVQTIVRRARGSLRCWRIDVSISSLKEKANGGDWSGVIDVSVQRSCVNAEYQPPPSGNTEIRSYTSSRCFLTEIQQSWECARACLTESATRVQIIRARVCFLSSGSSSALLVPPLRPISALYVCIQHWISDKWRVIHD